MLAKTTHTVRCATHTLQFHSAALRRIASPRDPVSSSLSQVPSLYAHWSWALTAAHLFVRMCCALRPPLRPPPSPHHRRRGRRRRGRRRRGRRRVDVARVCVARVCRACVIIQGSTSVAAAEHVVPVESSSFHELYCDGEHDGELRCTYRFSARYCRVCSALVLDYWRLLLAPVTGLRMYRTA